MVMRTLLLFMFLVCMFERTLQEVEECGTLNNVNGPVWNVIVYREVKNNGLELTCLGTAIKHNIFITAAHCLCDQSGKVKHEEFYVSTGEMNRFTERDNTNLQKVDKGNIFINNAFRGDLKRGDMAVVRLQSNFKSGKLAPLCIDWDNTRPLLLDGETLKQSIWQNGNVKVTDVSYVDYEHCQYVASNSFRKSLASDKICAMSSKDITGQIRDGAALIYSMHDQWYIRGVASTHDPDKTNLVIYSDIIFYLNWLADICVRL
ncbi:hypothetical protein NQ315_005226 [Exocentrus adspersus]|uniref:Peptidase S1 domain-containing protein n=1 Tax=Exocentrus adspersus TaxID=1586481 RepID=A0AAV8W2I5_9CUCU|nr:hypothetical protein NQ315_005226 [Exocentrus adspersus]